MKKITLILISLFILVIGISCASAADMNYNSIADDNVVMSEIGNGLLDAPALASESGISELIQTEPRPNITSESESELPALKSDSIRPKAITSESEISELAYPRPPKNITSESESEHPALASDSIRPKVTSESDSDSDSEHPALAYIKPRQSITSDSDSDSDSEHPALKSEALASESEITSGLIFP